MRLLKENKLSVILIIAAISLAAMNNPVTWVEKMFLPQNNFANPGYEANDSGLCLGDASGAAPTTDQSCSVSPSLTKAFETTNPIDGMRSIKISKGAANRQGEFVAIDFTIERSQVNKSNTLEFKYSATSNFVYGDSGDIKVYIADKTTSQVYATYPNTLDGSGHFQAQWAATENRNYQLLLWIPTTTTLAWDLTLDSFRNKLSDQLVVRTANPVYSAKIDTADAVTGETADFINGACTNATTGRATCTYNTGFWNGNIPNCTATVPRSSGTGVATIISESASQIIIETTNDNGTAANYGFTLNCQDSTPNPDIKVSGTVIPKVPVTIVANKASGSITANTTISTWTNTLKDSVGSFDASTGQITVKYPGDYDVSATITVSATSTSKLQIRKNGTVIYQSNAGTSSSRKTVTGTLVNLVVGDIITFTSDTSETIDVSALETFFKFEKRNDPSAFLTIPKVAYLKDVKAANTAGGTFTSGAWQTRTLNTLVDPFGIVSLSANQFTLQPGTYKINASAPASSGASELSIHKAKLRNITAGSDTIIGTSERVLEQTGEAATTRSHVLGVFSITVATTFEIQHRCSTTSATNGFGFPSNFGVDEVYTQVEIQKLL